MTEFACTIVGAGVHGLCAAFWLRRSGVRDLAVVERFGPDHERGSSHGATRITRSSYHDARFARMARRANDTAWPIVERELGRSLRVKTPGLFFGPPDGAFGDYLRATLDSGAQVEAIPADAARRSFPLLVVDDGDAALLDHTAAMVLAAETMRGLREWLAAHDVVMHWNREAMSVEERDGHVQVVTANDVIRSRAVVLATGAWLPRLSPGAPSPTVLRQDVGYFDVDADEAACRAGRFPVWARIGRGPEDFHYGLPSHDGAGLKVAAHRTTGPGADPDAPAPPVDEGALRAIASARFAAPLRGLRSTERCLYTMSADQGFRVARATGSRAIVAIAACSGHAFKFGPLIGQDAATAVSACADLR